MTVYRFQEVGLTARRSGKCPVCCKKVNRQRRFTNTLSPFNKNPDGTICTPQEVLAKVRKLCDEWDPDFTHDKCGSGPTTGDQP